MTQIRKTLPGRTGPDRSVAAIVVMGVTGCGIRRLSAKRSLATPRLALRRRRRLHPPENVAKMASGRPATDADRAGWLDAIRAAIADGIAGWTTASWPPVRR